MLEIIAETVADALAAQAGGADRIELVAALSEGGLTPSRGLIAEVLNAVTIPVHVMVRPHSRSFCYDEHDLRVMCADIRAIREMNAHGIVIGALTPDGRVDTAAMRLLMNETEGMSVTFHRAFDETGDLEEALRTVSEIPQVRRILTSGGKPSVLQAADKIKRLKQLADDRELMLLAGSGLTIETLESFVRESGAAEFHMGSAVRTGERGWAAVDAARVAAAKAILLRVRGRQICDNPQDAKNKYMQRRWNK